MYMSQIKRMLTEEVLDRLRRNTGIIEIHRNGDIAIGIRLETGNPGPGQEPERYIFNLFVRDQYVNIPYYPGKKGINQDVLQVLAHEYNKHYDMIGGQTRMNNIRTIVATEHDGMETRSLVINIHVLDETQASSFDIKSAVKKATHDYLCTKEGKEVFDYNCGGFNWADFESNVPNEYCRKYGFEKIESCASDLEVNWDEHLADDQALNQFWHEGEE